MAKPNWKEIVMQMEHYAVKDGRNPKSKDVREEIDAAMKEFKAQWKREKSLPEGWEDFIGG